MVFLEQAMGRGRSIIEHHSPFKDLHFNKHLDTCKGYSGWGNTEAALIEVQIVMN